MSKKSRARPGTKHSRKKLETGNGPGEATHTVDHERIVERLLHLRPPNKQDKDLAELRMMINMCISAHESDLAWSRHRLDIRDGIDNLGKMISEQMMKIERLRSIAKYQPWKERLHASEGGDPGVIIGLLPAMDGFLSVLANAWRRLKPKPGPRLDGRVLVAMLITLIEHYAGQRIGHSYKDALVPVLKEIVTAIDPSPDYAPAVIFE